MSSIAASWRRTRSCRSKLAQSSRERISRAGVPCRKPARRTAVTRAYCCGSPIPERRRGAIRLACMPALRRKRHVEPAPADARVAGLMIEPARRMTEAALDPVARAHLAIRPRTDTIGCIDPHSPDALLTDQGGIGGDTEAPRAVNSRSGSFL